MGASWVSVLLVVGGLPTGYPLLRGGLAVCAAGLRALSPFSLYDSVSSPSARRSARIPLSSSGGDRQRLFAPLRFVFLRCRQGFPASFFRLPWFKRRFKVALVPCGACPP